MLERVGGVGVKSMVDSAYTSLQRMISDVECCEMQMSSWCVRRAGRVVEGLGRAMGIRHAHTLLGR
jgi:hypothetical protein